LSAFHSTHENLASNHHSLLFRPSASVLLAYYAFC
jgi:hypothetical protein